MTQKVNNGVKKIFRNLKAFSLVELIIVIAIVAILSVAGFLTLQKRISQSRDSKRLGDLETIEKSLTVNYTDQDTAELYPMPDENNDGRVTTGTIDGETVAYKGTFGSGAIESVDNLNEVPVDPLDDERYAYGVTKDQQYFQIAAVLENGEKVSYNLTNRAYAVDKKSTVRGIYDGLMVYTSGESNYISNIPSLIYNNTGSLTNTSEVSYVVDGSSNLAYGEDTTQKESFEEVVRKAYGLSGGATVSFVNTGVDKVKNAIENNSLDKNIENSLGGNKGVIESKLEESGVSVDSSKEEMSCETGYFLEGGECKMQWRGDGSSSSPFIYKDNNGNIRYPKSCNDILTGEYEKANIEESQVYSGGSSSEFKNGVYQIDPDGDKGESPFEVYCDMNTDGGGWTLVIKSMKNDDSLSYSASIWTDGSTLNSNDFDLWNSSNSVYLSYSSVRGMEIMMNIDENTSNMNINLSNNLSTKKTALEMASSSGDELITDFYNNTNSDCDWATKIYRSSTWNLQRGSVAKGVNIDGGCTKVRFGIIAENEKDEPFFSGCWDSAIGMGVNTNDSNTLNSGNCWWTSSDCSSPYGFEERNHKFEKILLFIR